MEVDNGICAISIKIFRGEEKILWHFSQWNFIIHKKEMLLTFYNFLTIEGFEPAFKRFWKKLKLWKAFFLRAFKKLQQCSCFQNKMQRLDYLFLWKTSRIEEKSFPMWKACLFSLKRTWIKLRVGRVRERKRRFLEI